MNVTIDKYSGFCFGVVNAVKVAEQQLDTHGELYCLDEIVHNEMEVKRLLSKGLKIITYDDFKQMHNCRVLIRAHGEPPATYETALKNNITLIDASCPIVLKLQNKIKDSYNEMTKVNGQIVIYGKNGHAEVNGLVGQTENNAIVVDKEEDIEKIDFSYPIRLFSQTTRSVEGYEKIKKNINKKLKEKEINIDFSANDSFCRQVSNRAKELTEFALKHEVIIFVSGKKSSNGMILYELCKSVNNRTYLVSESSELMKEWFENIKNVGICGATSTPVWLMEEIAEMIREI